jgi:hypothetical protein
MESEGKCANNVFGLAETLQMQVLTRNKGCLEASEGAKEQTCQYFE